MGRIITSSDGVCTAAFAVSALALAAFAAPAAATEIKFPKDKPIVSFDVPDGWSTTYTADGLELRSPEKNSFVVANVTKRDRPVVEAWVKRANQTMMTEGVAFDANVKVPAQPAAAATMPMPAPVASSNAPLNPFTLSGDPAPDLKSTAPSEIKTEAGPLAIMPDSLGGIAQAERPKIPFKVVQFYGASFAGKPVDVQLVLFKVNATEMFLMEQASASDDNRAVGIISSVKAAQ